MLAEVVAAQLVVVGGEAGRVGPNPVQFDVVVVAGVEGAAAQLVELGPFPELDIDGSAGVQVLPPVSTTCTARIQ